MSTLPASNMGTRPLKQVARSVGTSMAGTQFKVQWPIPKPVRTVALVNVNLSPTAKVRVQAYSLPGGASLAYDSGWLAAYPVGTVAFGTVPWGSDRWWGGLPSMEDFNLYSKNVVRVLPQAVLVREIFVEIDDTSNSDGYLQIGRLFVGDGWSPTYNMTYGASIGYQSRTEVEEALGGAEYFDVRDGYRVAQFKLDHLDRAEAMGRVIDIQKAVDTHGEVMYMWDMDDDTYLTRTSFLGRLRQLDPIEQPFYDKFSTQFEIKELL